jgi:hypothetical protein
MHATILRSAYVASSVILSGGLTGMPVEKKLNQAYPLFIAHGGETNDIGTIAYGKESIALADLAVKGSDPFSVKHFTIVCDHGGGTDVAQDLAAVAVRFLEDHPFGTIDSPYGEKLPSVFPSYCHVHE